MRHVSVTLGACLALSACTENESTFPLGDQTLCVPTRYLAEVPSWIEAIPGLDRTREQLWVLIPAEEVVAEIPTYAPDTHVIRGSRRFRELSVLIGSARDIQGLSAAQTRLLEVTAEPDMEYVSEAGTELLRVHHYEKYPIWSLVRWRRDAGEAYPRERLYAWIAAYCSQYSFDEMQNCTAQRLYKGLTYQFPLPGLNLSNIDKLQTFIETRISGWLEACNKQT